MAGHKKTQGTQIAAGLTRRQILELNACAGCGECLVWCPVYAQDRRESITARGKIDSLRRIVSDGLPESDKKNFLDGLYECSACGQCHIVCPVRINTPELWEQARQSLVSAGIPQPEAQIKQLAAIKKFNNPFGKPQGERHWWAKAAWEAGLLKEPIPLWHEQESPVLYFAGCMASFEPSLQPVAVQSARLLQEAGVRFSVLGENEHCCISKLRRMGDGAFTEEARKRADMLAGMNIETIVVSCAGCFKGLYSDYARIWPKAQRVVHFSQFMDRLVQNGRQRLKETVPLTVTYHDPCHLGRHNQVYDEPRRVLQAIPGIRLIEMPRHRAFSSCCGMGGGLKVVSPEVQHRMAAGRIREAEAAGVEAIVTPCQTCYLGLLNGLNETDSYIKIYHLNELLVRSVCPEVTHNAVAASLARLSAG